jgi:hypothetical protein
MRVKLLLALMLITLSLTLKAQETKSACNFEYSVEAFKNPEGLDYENRFVNFKWDISKLSSNDSVSIEIVKIYDCFTGINGTQTEVYTILDLKSKDLINKNSLNIKHVEMIAKCFKWRVLLKSDSCLEEKDWNYYSFID